MPSLADRERSSRAEPHPLVVVLRWLASLRLAVVLIVVLAAVLAWATLLESAHGREYAQWHVYKNTWFLALLALLGVNILAAALVRWPWTKTRSGFVMTHAGLLVLLVGSIQTFMAGIDGQMIIEEGQTANMILLTERSQLTAMWPQERGLPPAAFLFNGGPVDWPDGTTLDMGELGGVHVKILRFLRHARTEEVWLEDKTGNGGPALKFALVGPGGGAAEENWLASGPFGGEVTIGPATFELHRTADASLLDDFTNPPHPKDMDEKGVLSLHYDGKMQRFPVSEHLGKEIALAEKGPRIEIVEYLPAARPGEGGKFTSQGNDPRNPMLEIQLHLPGSEQPVRQIAFARHPLLNLDSVHGKASPVTFWYHHPAVKPQAGTQFLQTPDGKLYARSAGGETYESRGEVKSGDTIATTAGFQVKLIDYLTHAAQETVFRPVTLARGESSGPEAAVLVEITAGGKSQQVWLKRNDDNLGFRVLESPEGSLAIAYSYERVPLDFSLKLHDFQRSSNPGGMGDASFASSVQLIDKAQKTDAKRMITMNEPLVHGKYTFYQSGFHELPDKDATVLTVAYDPGRFLKYLGSLMICVGVFFMFYTKANLTRKLWNAAIGRWTNRQSKISSPKESRRRGMAPTDRAEENTCVHAE
ncbi:MAG: cytochrome c biogenesis protein ResB [Pirellulales bacterium]|nr:cytochrome c biogenesis protein ResB [Pirellulales bacterium]